MNFLIITLLLSITTAKYAVFTSNIYDSQIPEFKGNEYSVVAELGRCYFIRSIQNADLGIVQTFSVKLEQKGTNAYLRLYGDKSCIQPIDQIPYYKFEFKINDKINEEYDVMVTLPTIDTHFKIFMKSKTQLLVGSVFIQCLKQGDIIKLFYSENGFSYIYLEQFKYGDSFGNLIKFEKPNYKFQEEEEQEHEIGFGASLFLSFIVKLYEYIAALFK